MLLPSWSLFLQVGSIQKLLLEVYLFIIRSRFAALGSDELRLTLGGGQFVENLVKPEILTLL